MRSFWPPTLLASWSCATLWVVQSVASEDPSAGGEVPSADGPRGNVRAPLHGACLLGVLGIMVVLPESSARGSEPAPITVGVRSCRSCPGPTGSHPALASNAGDPKRPLARVAARRHRRPRRRRGAVVTAAALAVPLGAAALGLGGGPHPDQGAGFPAR